MTDTSERFSAVLLGAGRGERLRPLTDLLPKPALPVLDVPLGACGLGRLVEAGLRPVVNVSHLGPELAQALRTVAPEVAVFEEPPEPYGSAGTLRELRAELADEVVVWNGDLLADIDLDALLAEHRRSGLPATVAVAPVSLGADLTVEEGLVTGFIDRRKDPKAPGARFLGAAVYGTEALDLIPSDGARGLGESVIAPLASRGELGSVLHEGIGLDVGTPARYLEANLLALEGEISLPHPGTVVTLGDGGRAYLGPGTKASPETLGPGAVVLADAEIGAGSRIERSVVWPDSEVPKGTVLEDAIWFGGEALPTA